MTFKALFRDRRHSGEQLANLVADEVRDLQFQNPTYCPVVYALPRGGIEVALPIARKLRCPLHIIVAKKITLPNNRELAIGAITARGKVAWFEDSYEHQRREILESAKNHAYEQAKTYNQIFAVHCPRIKTHEAIAILVDDGIATGLTSSPG